MLLPEKLIQERFLWKSKIWILISENTLKDLLKFFNWTNIRKVIEFGNLKKSNFFSILKRYYRKSKISFCNQNMRDAKKNLRMQNYLLQYGLNIFSAVFINFRFREYAMCEKNFSIQNYLLEKNPQISI